MIGPHRVKARFWACVTGASRHPKTGVRARLYGAAMRPRYWRRTDEQLLADRRAMGLLRAIAEGRLTRGSEGGFFAAYLLDGERLSPLWLRALQRDDLIDMPMGGPPRLAPRAVNLLTSGSQGML